MRVLAACEPVEILCQSPESARSARVFLDAHAVTAGRVRLHVVPTDRVWLRDSAPTGVHDASGRTVLVNWAFNAWAKYANWERDEQVGQAVARITGLSRETPRRKDTGRLIVLEGGGIDVNGEGLLLATEEWLLSQVQVRNPGLTRADYEEIFAEWLGVRFTIWLGEGCVGDDTHGHVDDVARFVTPDTIVLAVEDDPADENHERSLDNVRRLERLVASGEAGALRVVKLPFPRPVIMNGERLPASYANFYITNGAVLVPTYGCPQDAIALERLRPCFPNREVVGIDCRALIHQYGSLHCVTMQIPKAP